MRFLSSVEIRRVIAKNTEQNIKLIETQLHFHKSVDDEHGG